MGDNRDYYRRRMEEELAAAERSGDPAISGIHREMAARYRDMLSLQLAVVATSGETPRLDRVG
jgi:hypothetical protein